MQKKKAEIKQKLFKKIKQLIVLPFVAGLLTVSPVAQASDAPIKTFIGLYGKSKNPIIGFGLDTEIKIPANLKIDGTITISYDGKRIIPDLELAVSTSTQTSFGNLDLTYYLYSDQFYSIPLTQPGIGVGIRLENIQLNFEWLGGESGDLFLKYRLLLGENVELTPKIVMLILDKEIAGIGGELGLKIKLEKIIFFAKAAPMIDSGSGDLRACNIISGISFTL